MAETPEVAVINKNWEKIVSWALSMAATVALLIGAWFFSSLDEGLKTLKDEIGSLRIQIAVLKVSQDDLRTLENKMVTRDEFASHGYKLDKNQNRIVDHEKRMRELERGTSGGYAPHEARLRSLEDL